MRTLHMPDVFVGAHGTLFVLGLMSLSVSWWALITVAASGICLWANLTAAGAKGTDGGQHG